MSQGEERQSERRAGPPDRRAKLAFLGIVVAAMLVIYFTRQRGQAILPDWPAGIDETLRQAKREDRRILAIFLTMPPSETTKQLAATTLAKAHNRQAIGGGGFLTVKVVVDVGMNDPLSRRFQIRQLPTMLVLDPNGRQLNRREGMIGEMDFSRGFLDCTHVVKPAPADGARAASPPAR